MVTGYLNNLKVGSQFNHTLTEQKEKDPYPECFVCLQDAYGAFARQVLQKHELPVRRMYYVEDDVSSKFVIQGNWHRTLNML